MHDIKPFFVESLEGGLLNFVYKKDCLIFYALSRASTIASITTSAWFQRLLHVNISELNDLYDPGSCDSGTYSRGERRACKMPQGGSCCYKVVEKLLFKTKMTIIIHVMSNLHIINTILFYTIYSTAIVPPKVPQ